MQVHGGGKRLRHEFRALYDFYGKRVDYGEGEFPSRWPSDVAQASVSRARTHARTTSTFPCRGVLLCMQQISSPILNKKPTNAAAQTAILTVATFWGQTIRVAFVALAVA